VQSHALLLLGPVGVRVTHDGPRLEGPDLENNSNDCAYRYVVAYPCSEANYFSGMMKGLSSKFKKGRRVGSKICTKYLHSVYGRQVFILIFKEKQSCEERKTNWYILKGTSHYFRSAVKVCC
jgi:hypothetical protein